MTVLIGVRCSDGVVIGADSAATSATGNIHLLKLGYDKIVIVGGRVIVAGTGQIGLGQRFAEQVKLAHDQKLFQSKPVEVAKQLSAMGRNDFSQTGATMGSYGALVAAPADGVGQLIEFATADFQPELKNGKIHFVSMGSGQMLAEPFMSFVDRTFWKSKAPDVKTALFGVHWALSAIMHLTTQFDWRISCAWQRTSQTRFSTTKQKRSRTLRLRAGMAPPIAATAARFGCAA